MSATDQKMVEYVQNILDKYYKAADKKDKYNSNFWFSQFVACVGMLESVTGKRIMFSDDNRRVIGLWREM